MRLDVILRNKYLLGFIGIVVGLFLYAGLTSNFSIIPRLPFDLPFGRHVAPTAQLLSAPMLLPDQSGPTGVTAGQFAEHLEGLGARVTWRRGDDQKSWIMHYEMNNELTNAVFSGAGRLIYLKDASFAGVKGPATAFIGWAEDGQQATPTGVYTLVLSIVTAIRQGG